jgi:hypothetical protein
MATVIRSWRIQDDQLVELPEVPAGQQGLLETRLEGWLELHPDAIGDNLLIIGRQVPTASGPLDLLGITAEGVLVVLELKRDRAPRETVAQAIDYASWIADQSPEDLLALASEYLKRSLDEAFRQRFGQPLPEVDPTNLSVIVAASRLDAPTERMIQFLSRQYGMDIDGLLFRYIKLASGEEMLIRTSVISEERRSSRAEHAKPTPDALVRMARERGAEQILQVLRKLGDFLQEIPERTYDGSFRYWAPGRMLCGVNAATYWNAPNGSIDVWVSYGHWAQAYGLDESSVVERLQTFPVVKQYAGNHQIVVRISTHDQAVDLVSVLRAWTESSPTADQKDETPISVDGKPASFA